MELAQDNSRSIPDNLEVTSPEPDDPKDRGAKGSKLVGYTRGSRGYVIGLTFVAGLLLGWLVIGWWLWPVRWTNSEPWLLQPEHQRTFVWLVAENLWQTGDVFQAQRSLAGWDEKALAELLDTMEKETSSAEERQRLASLAEALELPTVDEGSLLASLFGQKAILLTGILSVAPLAVAVFITASSLTRSRERRVAELLFLEGKIPEELRGVLTPEQLREVLTQEEWEQFQAEGGWKQAEEGEEGKREGEEEGEEEGEKGKGEKGEEEEEADVEGYKYEEEEEEEAGEGEDLWTEALLSDFLEDEYSDIAQLEAICKNLPDVELSSLVESSKKVAEDLFRSNALSRK